MDIDFLSRDKEPLNALMGKMQKHAGYTFNYIHEEISTYDQIADYDVYVSPANSYGELKGGIDLQYYLLLGKDVLQQYVFDVIKKNYAGEILVGQCCLIKLERVDKKLKDKYLLLCPTMTVPLDVSATRNAYYFTRAMISGLRNMQKLGLKCNKVLCPTPCTGVGMMKSDIMALQVETAFAAFEGKGLIYAIYLNDEHSEAAKKYPEYRIRCIDQNAKMAYIQLIKGR